MLQDLTLDLRFALRSLTRSPGFTFLVVLTLAVGIGANTALFSVFDGVLLQPLDYTDSENLVTVLEPGRSPTSPANFLDLRDELDSIDHLTAASPWWPVLRRSGDLDEGTGTGSEQFPGLLATPELFDLLGAQAALGRTFDPALDGSADAPRVVVLGHEAWQRRFAGDPEIVGKVLSLDSEPHLVIGVMPEGFDFPPFWATEAEFWAPHRGDHEMWTQRSARFLRVFGRLAPDTDVALAQAEVDTAAARLATTFPDANDGLALEVEPLAEPVVGGVRGPLRTLLVGVGLVLLIACANVANLLLTRASGRRREIALRSVLGAPGRRVVRLLLTEGAVLAVLAGVAGWLVALWGLEAILALAPPEVPRLDTVGLDLRALLFTSGIALAVGLLLGLLPARTVLSWNLGKALSRGDRGAVGGDGPRGYLVAGELALALMLLAAAGLVGRQLHDLWRLDPGLRTEGVATWTLPFADSPHAEPANQQAFFEQTLAAARALPGVEGAALINHLHLGGDIWGYPFEIEGRPLERRGDAPQASYRVVSDDFFTVAEVPHLRGRIFDSRDHRDSTPVVVVNQTLADLHWPGENPVGQRLRGFRQEAAWLEVVGVVGDVRQWSLADPVQPELYFPYRQHPDPWWHQTSLIATTSGDPTALRRSFARALAEVAPGVPAAKPRTLGEILHQQRWQPRFNATLLSLFAGTALLLAAVGVYGVMSNTVALRRTELGIRAALGAEARQLVGLVLGRSLRLTFVGLLVGGVGAIALGDLLASQIPGVTPRDPLLLAAAAVLLTSIALAAAVLPAHRAGRVDPLATLRDD